MKWRADGVKQTKKHASLRLLSRSFVKKPELPPLSTYVSKLKSKTSSIWIRQRMSPRPKLFGNLWASVRKLSKKL